MIDPNHLRKHVIRPALECLSPQIQYSPVAENLLMGTASQESNLIYLKQLGGGPAVGLFQMEPATYEDIWEHYLNRKANLAAKLLSMCPDQKVPDASYMAGNLFFAAAMCRVHYYRKPDPLPKNDPFSLGQYWKKFYNTVHGAGTVDEFIENYKVVEA